MPVRAIFAVLLVVSGARASAEERPVFFAMDTAIQRGPAETAQTLAALGYDGFGGRPSTAREFAAALSRRRLRLVNAYQVVSFSDGDGDLPADLTQAIDALNGLDTTLWLAIQRVHVAGDVVPAPHAGDSVVVPALRRAVARATTSGVRMSLYPHAGFWVDSVDDCLRLVDAVDDPSLGVTFNLCHWLKVEGGERDPGPTLRAALSHLDFVTINGADAGDTRSFGWDRLIQPLGQGTYDVGGFVAKLKAVGYRGPIGVQGFGIRMDSEKLLRETMDAWRRF